MKKIYLFLLFLVCLLSTSAIGEAMTNKSNGAGEIDLSGDYPATKSRSLLKPIQVFIAEQSIKVNFNDVLGTIDVSVYDEAGNAVYQQSVNTYAGQQLFIDISSFHSGKYT